MPTYTVSAPAGRLSSVQKSALAREITKTHNEVTGAQTFFAQVVFQDVQDSNWFVGGASLGQAPTIYLCGHVRGGRPAEMKRSLILKLRDVLASNSGLPSNRVWVYLVELPPSLMLEYGHVLPEPGQESNWLSSMPAEDRAMLEALGR
jgi:phenylpyruvate tautomerase PptA (4-oxalocrotonate tautomerase family)